MSSPSLFRLFLATSIISLSFISPYIIADLATPSTPAVPIEATATTQSNIDSYIKHINDIRQEAGLDPLRENETLNSSAQLKANHMEKVNYWGHDAPDGTEPWHFIDMAGYQYTSAGENLARCFDTTADTVAGWYESKLHRDNMLGDYDEVGFGEYQRGDGCIVAVSHYGRM